MIRNKLKKSTHSSDNVLDNLTPTLQGIMALLETPHRQSELARLMKRKPSNVCRDLKKLKELNLVTKEDNHWRLSNFILSMRYYQGPSGSQEMITPLGKKDFNLHNCSWTLTLWNKPDGWDDLRQLEFGLGLPPEDHHYPHELAAAVDETVWNRAVGGDALNFHMGAYTVSVYEPSIRVYVPPITRPSQDQAVLDSFFDLLRFLPKLERWLRLPATCLYSHGRLNVRSSTRHISILKCYLAKYVIDELGCNHMVIRAPDGKEGIVIDQSQGPESELTRGKYGPDPLENVDQVMHEFAYGLVPFPSETKAALDMLGAQVVDVNKKMTGWQSDVSETMVEWSESQQVFARDFRKHTVIMGGYAEGTERSLEAAEKNEKAAEVLARGLDRLDKIFKVVEGPKAPASGSDLEAIRQARKKHYARK